MNMELDEAVKVYLGKLKICECGARADTYDAICKAKRGRPCAGFEKLLNVAQEIKARWPQPATRG